MKTRMCLVLMLAMVLSVLSPALAAESALVDAPQIQNELKTPVANVQSLSGDAAELLGSLSDVSVVLFDVSDCSDLVAALSTCKEQRIIPTVNVKNSDEVASLLDAMQESGMHDVTAVSADGALLSELRAKNLSVRLGLVTDGKDAKTISREIRSTPAIFCILPVDVADADLVYELQSAFHAVWVQVDEAVKTEPYTTAVLRALTSGANGVISQDASALKDVVSTFFLDNTFTRTAQIVGHRGDVSRGPENSMSAFVGAYENGADQIEMDLALTADGEVVLLHDHTLNRTTDYGGDQTIEEMTLAEVMRFRLLGTDGKPTTECVPTLRAVLEEFADKDCRLMLEIKTKTHAAALPAAKLICELGMEDKVTFVSFTADYLLSLRKNYPALATSFLYSQPHSAPDSAAVLSPLENAFLATHEADSAMYMQFQGFSRFFNQAAADRGSTVWIYTVNPPNYNKNFLLTPDGMTLDNPIWFKDMTKRLTVDVESTTMDKNGVGFSVFAETYGGEQAELLPGEFSVSVLTGADQITVRGGKIHANEGATGTACVMFSYQCSTPNGNEYVLYTQPITLSLDEPVPEPTPAAEEENGGFPVAIVISGGISLLFVGGALAFFLFKKKRMEQ